jgi:hypothetical protein
MRLLGYFVVVLLALHLLRLLPFVGAIFDVPILGFWGAAILVSLVASKATATAMDTRKLSRRIRDLGHVDTPHNQGKLGSLLAGERRFRRALPHLERAVAGEPDVAEWRYRLGCALLGSGCPKPSAGSISGSPSSERT